MRNDIYKLPELDFVGGQSLKVNWKLYTPTGVPFNAEDCTGEFAILDYIDEDDEERVISKPLEFLIGDTVNYKLKQQALEVLSAISRYTVEEIYRMCGISTAIDESDEVYNIASVTLDPADTVNLYGRFVYQLTLVNAKGEVEVPYQGICWIQNNIHKDYINSI